ncbi:BREX system serine/threonine kinase PglW [Verrucosispora sp. WMMA2044]|uniref:BREX system serine/threonine kinase PglW n=1 Tax=Verrucosispora sp. WMMA2044 TaxID=3016419 RepID=UPI00248ADE62|nr:BREX system serine/threonine kinase PglW [Verrucosispora sp. WMMA2044]WBB47303.1 BREX system serine/threonine kinase PglW [Verrucosispora sp. WMMA2044]
MAEVGQDRWIEVSPSQFPHEAEGLALVRGIMPSETPFRAWSNFEFRDSRGRWHEVDLLLLGRKQLHLIELKYYSGTLRGDDQRWARDGRRPEDSPLKLARRKAQFFASKLKDELRLWAQEQHVQIPDERDVIPFVQEAVFLHHPDLRCALGPSSAINLYGLDGRSTQSNLTEISELVLEPAGRRAIGPNQEHILVKLLERIGLVQRREREAGSWVIEDQAIDSDEGWQDWLAYHRVVQQDRARIRFRVLPPTAGQQERASARRIAEHEFRVMSRLQHDGLLRPRDLVESELGIGLVYPYDQQWQRLDLWLAGQNQGVPLATQLSMIRQIGEALQYAHNNRVVHRGLIPQAVWVRPVPGTQSDVKVRVGDWQGAGSVQGAAATHSSVHGVTSLVDAALADHGSGTAEVFSAPEGVWSADADRIRLDVFGLGTLAFYLITGRPPAPNRSALRQRLRDQHGLDLAIELPQVPSTLRSLVLKATDPAPSRRTADVAAFLSQLAAAERDAATSEETDPLEAAPGAVLDGRFRLVRRLGQGSTAVGLLVQDLHVEGNGECVLKVALDDTAATRLDDEAEALRRLDVPRIVKILEGPIVVGGRRALLLESAGPETLTTALRTRTRLSFDLLERYGTDLLDCLVALDKAGIDHRDIKPSNLGVRESRGDRTKHLILFDFSLTRAAASATQAGTPPYLDPFLIGTRDRYDSAAERYAAAVVLFEMATGSTPVYGDGEGDPGSIPDEATIRPEMFDATLAGDLVDFFRKALARDAGARHHTAEAMRAAWLRIFAKDATTEPDESYDELAARATLTTPLRDSGLTARALSALEPYAVQTVGELLTVDPVQLSRLQGVKNATRLQLTSRIKEWRARLGSEIRTAERSGPELTPTAAADLLLRVVATPRSPSRGGVVRLILGFDTTLDAFATHAQLGANLDEPVQQSRVTTLLGTLQERWAGDHDARALLDRLAEAVSARLTELGSVATIAELTRTVAETLAPAAHPDERLARGLLRFALERRKAMNKADGSQPPVWVRRRAGVVTLLAEDQALCDVAESLASEADRLVNAAGDAANLVIPAQRVQARLEAAVPTESGWPAALADPLRRVTLAAAASTHAAASGAGDLHHRGFTAVAALAQTFADFGGQQLTPDEIRERVRVRFPAVPELPRRPTLDSLITEAGLGLIFDDRLRVYRALDTGSATTGLDSRSATSLAVTTSPVGATGALGARLETSIGSRSFLALGTRADRLGRLIDAVKARYGATTVDLTGALLDALRAVSAAANMPWDLVRAADAERESSRPRRGLDELIRRSWPEVEATVERALSAGRDDSPVLLTDASPLARYGNMALLTRWTDLAAPRRRAVWLLVPQLNGNHGPVIDGRPVPLAAPNQFVNLDNEWIDSTAALTAATQKEQ